MFRFAMPCLALFSSTLLAWGQPYSEIPDPSLLAPLYQVPKFVPEELSSAQVTQLNELSHRVQRDYGDRIAQIRNLPPAQRAIRIDELKRLYEQYWSAGLRDIVNQNDISRFRQFELPYSGSNEFSNPYVLKRLDLTENQRQHLQDLMAWDRQQMEALDRQIQTDNDKEQRLYADYVRKHRDRLNDILTPNQLKTWRGTTGEASQLHGPITLPKR